jgi:hypothetical protein
MIKTHGGTVQAFLNISLKIKSLIKCFHKMKQNAIDLKKNRQKINGHGTLSDAGRLRTHRDARGQFSK